MRASFARSAAEVRLFAAYGARFSHVYSKHDRPDVLLVQIALY